MTMGKKDMVSSLVWLLFAFFVCFVSAYTLPLGSWHNPGAGFLPFGAGLFLGIFSAITFVRAVLHRIPGDQESLWPTGKSKDLILILASLLGYAALMDFLGYLIATFVLLLFIFKVVERKKWLVSLGGSLLGTAFYYALFDLWLKSQLPKGILGS
jgi:putative tricarboxylic transport membrane protein